jgi:hypothetical protein
MEWLMGEEKGGTTGYGNVMSLQPVKQHALSKMAYSMDECVCVLSKHFTKPLVL